MTPVFSSSECVISLVLSCFYLSEGGTPFLCFFVLATVVLLNAVISRVLAWFGWTSERSRFVYDTVFWRFAILDCSRFLLGAAISRVFGAGFELLCVFVLRLVFALKLWSFVAVMHACRRWR